MSASRPHAWFRPGANADAPTTRALWIAVDSFRVFALAYAAWTLAHRTDALHPAAGWAVLGVLGAWTVFALLSRRPTDARLVVESALGVAAILLTGWIDPVVVTDTGASTLPGVWPGATVLAWGVHRGVVPGMVAAAVVSAADVIEIGHPSAGTTHNIILLFAMGACAGYCADAARRGDAALAEGLRLQARTRERERLARTVHDGVLQTLSLVHRRGVDAGGEAAELGRLAGEQERVLRSLISEVEAIPPDPREAPTRAAATAATAAGTVFGPAAAPAPYVDVRALLRARGAPGVEIVLPADPVMLAADRAAELDAAVAEVLANVARHAGPGARAWVLAEAEDGDAVVTVRDDGVGIPPGRLAQAREQGRLGVAASVCGRLADCGGRATYAASGGRGTRVELRLPAHDPHS